MSSKKIVSYLFLCTLLGGLAYSCQNRPNEVLNKKQMEQLMYDVYIAEATMENDYNNFDTPEKKEAYINKIFKAHKTTQAQWDTSLSWYSDRIDLYLKMNDSVKARLERARQETDALMTLQSRTQQADLAQFPSSYLPPIYTFSTPDTKRGFRFRLDSTEISSKIDEDNFLFTFSVIGISPRLPFTFTSLLTLVYSDTTIYRFQKIRENRTYEFTASKYIPGDTIIEITGFVHLQDSTGVPPIQLYNISLGDMTASDSKVDTLRSNPDIPDKKPLMPDSMKPMEPDSMKALKPNSRKSLKADSKKEI